MKSSKLAILAGAAVCAFVAAVPANATWYNDNRGDVNSWGSSGWTSSGWASSGWGSSGWNGGTSSIPTASTSTGSSTSTGGPGSGPTGPNLGAGPVTSADPVPEPPSLLMLGLGVVGLVTGRLIARRRRKKA